jgi:hypothetical protein
MIAAERHGAGILPPAIGMDPTERGILCPRAKSVQRDFMRLAAVDEEDPAYGAISSQSDKPAPG